jgi:hypothetical protein
MIICSFGRRACAKPRSCRKVMVGQALKAGAGNQFIVRDRNPHRKRLLALLLLAPFMAGCAGGSSDIFSSDSQWFARSGRLFIRNIEAPPLSPNRQLTAEDLVSAEGFCPGMAPPNGPADANALTDGAAGAPAPSTTGTVALGHTECDVVRGIGAPDGVNLSTNGRGDRVAVVNYSRGPRAGIYTFTAGRLSSIERGPEPLEQPRAARPKPKKKPAAT